MFFLLWLRVIRRYYSRIWTILNGKCRMNIYNIVPWYVPHTRIIYKIAWWWVIAKMELWWWSNQVCTYNNQQSTIYIHKQIDTNYCMYTYIYTCWILTSGIWIWYNTVCIPDIARYNCGCCRIYDGSLVGNADIDEWRDIGHELNPSLTGFKQIPSCYLT